MSSKNRGSRLDEQWRERQRRKQHERMEAEEEAKKRASEEAAKAKAKAEPQEVAESQTATTDEGSPTEPGKTT